MRKSFKIRNIQPNPFRHIEHYPIQRKKVEALKESIESTGFWDNVVARPANGGAEIAYGHHRLAALREVYGPDAEVELIVRDLDDSTMLKIMARENMEEWGTSVWVEMETIKSVVEAYADGRIELPRVPEATSKDAIRYAPSFQRGAPGPGDRPYTAKSLASFLGWTRGESDRPSLAVETALAALELVEEGVLEEDDFEGMSREQALTTIRESRRAQKRKEQAARLHEREAEQAERQAQESKDKNVRQRAMRRASEERKKAKRLKKEGRKARKKVAKTVSRELRQGTIGTKKARQRGQEIAPPEKQKEQVVYAYEVAQKVSNEVTRVLDPDYHRLAEKLDEVVRLRDHIDDDDRDEIAGTLKQLARRALDYANDIRASEGAAGLLEE